MKKNKIASFALGLGRAITESPLSRKILSAALALTVVLTPLSPSLSVFADEVTKEDEVVAETTAPTETQVQETEPAAPVETTVVPDYSEYATDETTVTAENDDIIPSDPTEEIDTTAPPVPTETERTEETEPLPVGTTVETSVETSVEETDPTTTETTVESSEETTETSVESEEPAVDVIQKANSASEYIDIVSAFPSGDKLIVKTTDELSGLNPDFGVYFDGTYMLGFVDQRAFNAAVDYVESKGYVYTIDGQFSLCGGFDNVILNKGVNPSASVRVAVIDTGSNTANEYYSVVGDDVADHNGHGTAMCNYILNETDDAYIISIKAIEGNKGQVSDVYAAIQYAETLNVDYILLAMSIKDNGEYDALKTLIKNCNATVVASAGNNGRDASGYIPAGVSGVTTVGAIDYDNVIRSFSNYGTCVNYYIVADSTSEASAVALGRIIKYKGTEDFDAYLNTYAIKNDDMYYFEGSEYYFTPDNTVDGISYTGTLHTGTKTITVLNPQDIRINPIDGKTVTESFYYYSLDYAQWATGKSMPGGCIRLAIGAYIYGATPNCSTTQVGDHTFTASTGFRFDFTGTNSFMSSGGYSSASGIGLTGLNASNAVAAGNDFYNYVRKYATPGDMIMFGYPGSSNAWRHVVIYEGTVSAGNAPEQEQYYYGGVKRNSVIVREATEGNPYGARRVINAQDFTVTEGNKAATSAVILKAVGASPEAYFSLDKVLGNNAGYLVNNTYSFTLTDTTANVQVATGSVTVASTTGLSSVTWSNVAAGYSLEDQNLTVVLIPDHDYIVTETTTTVNGRGITVDWYKGTTSLGSGESQSFTAVAGESYQFKATNNTTVQVSFTKSSTNPTCVANNAMYSLAGTTYAVYGSQADAANDQNRLTLKNGATVINFNASGVADTVFETTNTTGTYYVKELTAGPGYKLDTVTHTVQLNNVDTTVSLTDEPLFDPFVFRFVKTDNEHWDMVTELTQAGATFDFYYYDNADTYGNFASYTASHTPKAQGVIAMSAMSGSSDGTFSFTPQDLNAAGITYFAPFTGNNDFPIGTYIIKERTGPAGYAVSPEDFAWCITQNGENAVVTPLTVSQTFTYTALENSTVYMAEQSKGFGVGNFKKVVASNNGLETLAPDLYSLDGTVYEVYAANSDKLMLTITFDGNGDVKNVVYASGVTPSAAHKWTSGNEIILPYTSDTNGAYYIKEKTSTKGYYLDTAKHNFTVTAASTTDVTVSDEPVVAPFDALLKKATSDTLSDEVLAALSVKGANFTVTYYPGIYTTQTALNSATPILEATFVTDDNGVFKFDEQWYTTEFASSMYASLVNQLKDKSGKFMAPMGTYVVREITAPTGLDKSDTALIIPVEFNNNIVKGSADDPANKTAWTASIHYAVLTGVVYNESTGMWEYPNSINPTITTNAANTVGGTELKADKDQSITDKISVTRLAAGFSYKDTAWIVSDNGTPNDLTDDFYVPFAGSTVVNGIPCITVDVKTNSTGSDSADFSIRFDGIDATDLGGHTLTVCNELYLIDTNGVSHLYLSHKALDNKLEQVTVPAIRTTLLDVKVDTFNPSADVWGTYTDSVGYRKVLSYGTNETLIDHVAYKKLIVGEEYEATATLKNKDTGADLLDANGKPYTATKTFTATAENGVVEVEFTGVDTTKFVSAIVCFEDIEHNGISVASHADLSDEWQTLEKVELKTTAIDKNTGTRVMTLTEDIPVMDKVEFNNLKVGDKYIIEGSIMQGDGTPLLDKSGNPVVVEVPFTPTVSSGETWIDFGTVYVPYTVTSIVIFENLYIEESHTLISVHASLDDTEQTLVRPTAHTVANVNGQKAVWLGSTQVVTLEVEDKIMFEGLIPGKMYRSDCSLMKADGTPAKDKDGKDSVASVTFVPTEADGEVFVKASFSTEGLVEGDIIVVFENIYDVAEDVEIQNGEQTTDLLIAKHEDLSDKDQTITVHFRPMTGAVDTPYAKYGAVLIIAALGGCLSFRVVKKKNEKAEAENP